MQIIHNWRKAWRMLSVQMAALIVALGAAEPLLPQLREVLPDNWYAFAACAVIVARLVAQPKVEGDTGPPPG